MINKTRLDLFNACQELKAEIITNTDKLNRKDQETLKRNIWSIEKTIDKAFFSHPGRDQ